MMYYAQCSTQVYWPTGWLLTQLCSVSNSFALSLALSVALSVALPVALPLAVRGGLVFLEGGV